MGRTRDFISFCIAGCELSVQKIYRLFCHCENYCILAGTQGRRAFQPTMAETLASKGFQNNGENNEVKSRIAQSSQILAGRGFRRIERFKYFFAALKKHINLSPLLNHF